MSAPHSSTAAVPSATLQRPLVIACAALTADLRAVLSAGALRDAVEVDYLPANLHNTPNLIVAHVRERLERAARAGRPVFVAYADCGTGGRLDALLAEFDVQRLPGAHCYELFAGPARFAALHEEELGTFYLTDFLAKHFDALVWNGLGLDCSPQLLETYFGNYTRLVLLAQTDDVEVTARAAAAAARLGLSFERLLVGRDALAGAVGEWSLGIPRRADAPNGASV
ncbi:MAG: DUF1638 domain-containing protein [Ilumatobacteraceae bacterium]